MKRLLPFQRFDPRLAAELRSQRRPILIGLLCTAAASALYAGTIKLTELATGTIQKLANIAAGSHRGWSPDQLAQAVGGDWSRRSAEELRNLTESQLADLERVAEQVLRTQTLQQLLWVSLATVGMFALRYFFMRGQVYFLSEAANRLAGSLRVRLFKKLLELPVSYFNERRAGSIHSILTNDVGVYQSAVGIVRDSIDAPIKALGAFAVILWIQPQLAVLALLMVPLLASIIQRNSRKMRVAQAQVQTDLADLSATTQEVLQGTRVVKAFGAEERTAGDYANQVERSFNSTMKAVGITAKLRPMVELIGAVALALFFYFGGLLALQGTLQVSHIVAMAFAMDAINQGFRSFAGISNTLASVTAASDRIYGQILDVPRTLDDAAGAVPLVQPKGRIEFRNVSFAYPDGTRALSGVSFAIEPGTSLALVGPSGAGKSTIADLLLRFYDPTEGSIHFDGVDLRELPTAWLRSQIGVVPQHTFLFAGTIHDNVRMGRPEATDEDVEEALRQANALEFTLDMSTRSVAELGERGVRLSGGQMQRVAIARALVRQPAVLLLDEATSALDASSEKVVTEALEAVMQSRTTLFIAHRLTTAARADRILVLSRGEVVETGCHTELMEKQGVYAGLFRAFSSGVLD